MTLHYEDIQPIEQALSGISDKLPKAPARFITKLNYEDYQELILSKEFSPLLYRLHLPELWLTLENSADGKSALRIASGQQAVDLWNKLSKGAELVKSEYSVIVGYTDAEGEAQEISYKFNAISAEEAAKKVLNWAIDSYLEWDTPEVKNSVKILSCSVFEGIRGIDF